MLWQEAAWVSENKGGDKLTMLPGKGRSINTVDSQCEVRAGKREETMGEFSEVESLQISSASTREQLLSLIVQISGTPSGPSQLPLVSQTLGSKWLLYLLYTLEEVEASSNGAKALKWIIQKTFRFSVDSGKSCDLWLYQGVSTQLTALSTPMTKSKRALFLWNTTVPVGEFNEALFTDGNDKLDLSFQVQFEALESQGKLDCWETFHLEITAEIRFFPWPSKCRDGGFLCFLFFGFGKSQGSSIAISRDKILALVSHSFKDSFLSQKNSRVLLGFTVIPTT